MDKGSSAKFLIALVLMSGTLSGCISGESSKSQGSTSPNTQSSTTNGSVPSPISSEVKQKFKDLKNAYDKYKESQDQLLSNLPDKIDENNPRPPINTKDVGDKLEEFAQASKNFRKALKTLNHQDRKYQILEQLDKTQKELSLKVLKPLENGLEEQAITEIQKNLKVFETEKIDPKHYGSWADKTKYHTTIFLEENAKKLATNIQDLEIERAVNSDETSTNSTTTSPRPSPTPTSSQTSTVISEQVKVLTEKVNNLQLVSFVSLGLAIVAVLISLYKLFGQSRTEKNNSRQPQTTEYSITHSSQSDDFNQIINNISKELNRINNRLQEIEKIKQQASSQVNYHPRDISDSYPQIATTNSAPNQQALKKNSPTQRPGVQFYSQCSKLVEQYNHDANKLLKTATKVSETEESINKRRMGMGTYETVVIEKTGQGNYCIISEAGASYMVPKPSFKPNEHNYGTFETLFECYGYKSGYSHSFKLVKPARVNPTSENQWQLKERGIVEFY
ncbi:hypothetical protein QT971_05330 [Microcoleus sp. herbarium19]|uniref:hypothetical protein n=1 Tax=unclassified Microcoleus TaxID=2642155 RepID=UPI002FD6DB55